MAVIVESIAGDRRIQLGNQQFYRRMAFGSNWNSIRIGIRMVFTATANFTGFPYIGVSTGPNDYTGASADHVGGTIGRTTLTDVSLTYYSAGPVEVYAAGGTASKFGRFSKVGNSEVTALDAGYNNTNHASSPATNASAIYIDIVKGSPNYTIKAMYPSSNSGIYLLTAYQFFQQLESEGVTSILTGYMDRLSGTIAYSGTGLLDHVFLRWYKNTPLWEIANLAVIRLT